MLTTEGYTNSFSTWIQGAGLFVTVQGGIVLNNNTEVSVPESIISLAASSSNYIFFSLTNNLLQVNTTGFPSGIIPIATVFTSFNTVMAIVDERPDFVIISTPVAFVNAPGTELTSGNFSFSGWGSGATLTVNSGTQTGFSITMAAGSSPSSQPTVTLAFNTGYSNPPISIARVIGGTGMFADVLASNTNSQSVLTYDGIPQSGKTYVLNVFVLGQ